MVDPSPRMKAAAKLKAKRAAKAAKSAKAAAVPGPKGPRRQLKLKKGPVMKDNQVTVDSLPAGYKPPVVGSGFKSMDSHIAAALTGNKKKTPKKTKPKKDAPGEGFNHPAYKAAGCRKA